VSDCIGLRNNDLIVSRSIADTDGPKVADTFYENLLRNHGSVTSTPDTSQSCPGHSIFAVSKKTPLRFSKGVFLFSPFFWGRFGVSLSFFKFFWEKV